MAVNLSALAGAGQQFFDNSGVILSGGKLYSYAAGTTTPQATYTSASGATAHTNPIVLNSAGRVSTGEIWLTAGSNYKFALYTSTDVLIATWDNITGINGTGITSNASNVAYDPAGTGAVATTVQAKLRQIVSVKDFGAVGNGVNNDAPAIAAAITATIAAGGGAVYFPAGQYKCTTLIGAFVNVDNLTLLGYGAEVQHYAGQSVTGLLQFGNGAIGTGGMWSGTTVTATNIKILGIKFTTSNSWNTTNPNRWADTLPLSFHTSENVIIKDCSFNNYDFAAIDFGAPCKNVLVDGCTFTCDLGKGNVVYGVRPFCYGTTTNYQNGNGDLSPTDPATGILKAGYTFISQTSAYWGHENISVTNCHFENISHGVLVSAARWGVISNNTFKNFQTRGISLTTYSQQYSCHGNVFTYNTAEQTSLDVSTFYGIGQATFRHVIDNEVFIVAGTSPVGTGFNPIYFYENSHQWVLKNCVFYNGDFTGAGGSTTIATGTNADGSITNNKFDVVTASAIFVTPNSVASPGFQQDTIEIIGNLFKNVGTRPIVIGDTTSAPSPVIITGNTLDVNCSDFVATTFSAAGKVAKLFLDKNDIVNFTTAGGRYIFNTTANKAVILSQDVINIQLPFITSGLSNPGSESITLSFSDYSIPSSFTVKRYTFTVYGGGENSQTRDGMSLVITAETATSVTFTVSRSTGTSTQTGQGTFTINLFGLIT